MVVVAFIFAGCSTVKVYRSDPPTQLASNDYFDAEFEPQRAKGYDYFNSFRFVLTNKTDKDFILDWSKTYYLRNGKRHGNFGWEGLTFEQLRDIQEEPEILIGPGKTDSIEIFPTKLIGWKEEGVRMKATTPEAGFTLTPLPEGENGMSIAVLQNGKLLRKRIVVKITMN